MVGAAVQAAEAGDAVSTRAAVPRFRGDIDSLRAVAILAVVGYHAELPGFRGGFTGVDVFFVISGYLITRNLLAEATGRGAVRLGRFWARRVRRLVPALGLVVLATLVASYLILPVVELDRVARQGAAAALYVSNVLFARQAQDYFATDVDRSPFLHTWSLGVEEQFYLVWPLLVAAVVLGFRRRPEHLRTALGVTFGLVLAASFGLNLVQTGEGSSWAFFGLPARAWEFAAAGLLATVTIPEALRTGVSRTVAGVVGIAMIVVGVVVLSDAQAYPGARALLPVVGTLLVIAAGDRPAGGHRTIVPKVLGAEALQWFGRLSYSWYLWHWPFIVLAVAAVGEDTVALRTGAAAVSLGVAYLAYRFVENPVRFGERFRASGRTFAMGAAVTLVALLGAGGLTVAGDASTSDLDEMMRQAQEEFLTAPSNCVVQESPVGTSYSRCGDPGASRVVLLVGDSHAFHWLKALALMAETEDLLVVLSAGPSCPATAVSVRSTPPGLDAQGCAEQRQGTAALLEEYDVDAVVLAQSNGYVGSILDDAGGVPDPETQARIWGASLDAYLRDLQARGLPVVVILDNPTLPDDPMECLARARDIDACELERAEALAQVAPLRAAEQQVLAALPEVPRFDATQAVCDEEACRLEADGALVYVDKDHLSADFTRSLAPELARLLDQLPAG
jgi:peptidoglycan/LPS O-acetylase OafA/YrhL